MLLPGLRVPIGKGVAGTVARTKNVLNIPGERQSPLCAYALPMPCPIASVCVCATQVRYQSKCTERAYAAPVLAQVHVDRLTGYATKTLVQQPAICYAKCYARCPVLITWAALPGVRAYNGNGVTASSGLSGRSIARMLVPDTP
eukprot:2116648-Rhodomonas_salina.4